MNTSDYGVLLQILSSPLEQVEAEMFREAITEVERKNNSIFPVVMARSNAEVALQINTYDETYGEDLIKQEWLIVFNADAMVANVDMEQHIHDTSCGGRGLFGGLESLDTIDGEEDLDAHVLCYL
ncbi:hypothetical protein PsorP6_000752 [Peronosclerospora sorghi]|uniref:Uncharacterized protein n=1 Tax=Peronosclerospora sorghi TaxID=230839 RepID=A0ACC0WSQ4_9STRA|nr:hypothetical protein PsorP6_000752 [Peronosclerospora sorghi]